MRKRRGKKMVEEREREREREKEREREIKGEGISVVTGKLKSG